MTSTKHFCYTYFTKYKRINIIRRVLRNGDVLLTNVDISYDGRKAELDNVIINKYGVFIIEVKNYAGTIYGKTDDYTWIKCKTDPYGNTFTKTVRNPIKQVNRHEYDVEVLPSVYVITVFVHKYGFSADVSGGVCTWKKIFYIFNRRTYRNLY